MEILNEWLRNYLNCLIEFYSLSPFPKNIQSFKYSINVMSLLYVTSHYYYCPSIQHWLHDRQTEQNQKKL